MTVLAGALLGLLGSAHCVAMCGPLVLTVGAPARDCRLARRAVHVGCYHAGRVSTYALLGVVAGLAGTIVSLAGFGRVFALGGGVALLAASIGPAFVRRCPFGIGTWMGLVARASGTARRWQARHPVAGAFGAGMANGLLPCGMVYAALAAALAAGSVGHAVWTMAAFGAGTVPALAAVSLSAAQIPEAWRRRVSRLAPIGLAIAGILLVVRGVMPPAVHAANPHQHDHSGASWISTR